MSNISLEIENIKPFLSESKIFGLQEKVDKLHAALEKGQGLGSDFLGWLHLPSRMEDTAFRDIEDTAAQIRKDFDTFVCIGIGGSYLGVRAAINFLSPGFSHSQPTNNTPEIYFAGHYEILSDIMENKGLECGMSQIFRSQMSTHHNFDIIISPSSERVRTSFFLFVSRACEACSGTYFSSKERK